ncbi:hypothetical protein [Acinetobacter sp. ANC 4805]|jgi:hypothetical protein|uniref:hypothetical protein n=1 Tax=Acinetobacter sp. ANC 4805 TaxID=2923425 RepID=UPI001F4A9905|nr:hypothetical protein [Acinetobacter sp. ANC 4805]MCH7310323.1 hypothetical protein [Acinetobacter sp. ANC 4805]
MVELKVSADDDVMYLFERVVKHLQASYRYSSDEAIQLVNDYFASFTSPTFCYEYAIPVQDDDFFCHIEALGMADRVQYYQGLKKLPDERAFIDWQRSVRA